MRQARSRPPDLPGFTHKRWLGGGGFADVFLYDQHRPAREVAVKVLLVGDVTAEDRRAFDAEADLMARVSAHPYIVTIFGADVAPDGRPFLLMEFYPRPHYGERVRGPDIGLAEALQVGVRVASAVETAHRAGILHRDIKPANVLVNEYGRPGLSDFGIAGALDPAGTEEAAGLSVPYAAPEVITEDSPGDERSDVYSLAGTVYALLAGRSPFEVANGSNAAHELAARVLRGQVPSVGRDDVPPALEHLLQQALARDPSQRPPSAAAFAGGLREIERSLQLAPTDFEVRTDDREALRNARADGDHDGAGAAERYRTRRAQVVRPEPGNLIASMPNATAGPVDREVASRISPSVAERVVITEVPHTPRSMASLRDAPQAVDTMARPARPNRLVSVPDAQLAPSTARPSRRTLVTAGLVVVLVALGVAVALLSGEPDGGVAAETTEPSPVDPTVLVLLAQPPSDVEVEVGGDAAQVTWAPVDPDDDQAFLVRRAGSDQPPTEVTGTETTIGDVVTGESVCVQVATIRGTQVSAYSEPVCDS